MIKKSISVLLVLLMIISAFTIIPFSASAVTDDPNYLMFQSNAYSAKFDEVFVDSYSKSFAKTLYDEYKSDSLLMGSIKAWEDLHIVTSPSYSFETGQINKKDFYKVILFDLFDYSNTGTLSEQVADTLGNPEDIFKGVKNERTSFALSVLKKICTDNAVSVDGLTSINPKDINLHADYVLVEGNAFADDAKTLSDVNKILGIVDDVYKGVSLIADYLAVKELNESTLAVLDIIINDTSNPGELRSAAQSYKTCAQGGYEKVLTAMTEGATYGLTKAFEEVSDEVWKSVIASIPGGEAVMLGAQGGRALCNYLFSSDKLTKAFYQLEADVLWEDAVTKALKSASNTYLNNKTETNAKIYMSAVELFKDTVLLGFDYSKDILEIAANSEFNTMTDFWFGNYSECISLINQVQDLKKTKCNNYGLFEDMVLRRYKQLYFPDYDSYENLTNYQNIPISSIELLQTKDILIGDSGYIEDYIKVSALPDNQTEILCLTWNSSDERVIKFKQDSYGECLGEFVCLSEGYCTLTAKTLSGINAQITISVTNYNNSGYLSDMYHEGDTFTFGYYPQTYITDSTLIENLNKIDTTVFETKEMEYKDVYYDGNKYRKVNLKRLINSNNGSQNTFVENTDYWFKWDPIIWRVYKKDDESIYAVSESILDCCQAGSVNWEKSDIRQWLNYDFFYSAFSPTQQEKIEYTYVKNGNDNEFHIDSGNDTYDKVWILSLEEAENMYYVNYNTNDLPAYRAYNTRSSKGTTYARNQGLWVATKTYTSSRVGASWWILRTPGDSSSSLCNIDFNGALNGYPYMPYMPVSAKAYSGIKPAIRLKSDTIVPFYQDIHFHEFETSIISPTCTKDGEKIRVCNKCNYTITSSTAKLGHSYSTEIHEPSCIEKGYASHVCLNCGDEYKDNYTEKLSHNFVDGICPMCGMSEDECVESSHPYENNMDEIWTIHKEGAQRIALTFSKNTETESGYDYICLYNGSDNQVGKYSGSELSGKRIAVKGDTIKIRLTSDGSTTDFGFSISKVQTYYEECEHNETELVNSREATCGSDGYSGDKVCKECGDIIEKGNAISATGVHDMDEMVYPPTCGEKGYTHHYCKNCRYSYDDNYTDATGEHDMSETVYPPTCGEKGYTHHYCKNCRYSYDDNYTDATGEHDMSETVYPPTCGEKGYAHHYCKNCRYSYDDNYIDATGEHDMSKTVYPPTCGEQGYTYHYCKNCRYSYNSDYTDATGEHDIDETVYPPTCGDQGYTHHYCKNCWYSYNDSYTEATGEHDIDETVYPPTCGDQGYTHHYCKNCWYSYNDSYTEATGEHEMDETIYPPTCGDQGYTHHYCKSCWYSYNDTYTDVTGAHQFENGACKICGKIDVEGIDNLISIGDEINVNIESEGQHQYYKFVPKEDVEVSLHLSGDEYAYCSVYDENANRIDVNFNYASENDYRIDLLLDEGKHYIFDCCLGYGGTTGSFNLKLDYTADVDDSEDNYQYYENDDGTITINGYSGKTRKLSIPEEIHGKKVTRIGYYAFEYYNVTDVIIPEGVTEIDHAAFGSCRRLRTVTLPNTVSYINKAAFEGCVRLKSFDVGNENESFSTLDGNLYNKEKTEFVRYAAGKSNISFVMPENVNEISNAAFQDCLHLESIELCDDITTIGEEAFRDCEKLREINIPTNLGKIEGLSFYGCESLEKISIPDSVTSIGESSFRGCSSLEKVDISKRVDVIGSDAFASCSGLCEIVVDEDNQNYSSLDGVLFSKDRTMLMLYALGSEKISYTIPDTVTTIDSSAFRGAKNLQSVSMGDNVIYINEFAFADCDSLNNVSLSDSLESLGYGVFLYCTNIKEIVLPDSITGLYGNNFFGCSSLESIKLPDNLERIGSQCFQDCVNLKSIDIPDSVEKIGTQAFDDCYKLVSVKLPKNLKTIESNCFNNCYCLEEVIIPEEVTSIGYGAFDDCIGLKHLTISKGVEFISGSAFSGCTSLLEVTLPKSVKTIGDYAFESCTNLSDVYYFGSEKEWDNITIGYHNSNLTNATIHFNSEGSGPTKTIVDKSTGVLVTTNSVAELNVEKLTDSESATDIIAVLDKSEKLADLYDIYLTKDGVTIQPDEPATVKIPTDSQNAKVYRIENNGTKTDMNAVYDNGYMVFTTNHFSLYAIVIPNDYVIGDVNRDGSVTVQDATQIQKYLVHIVGFGDEQIAASDINGDRKIDVRDITQIQKYLANLVDSLG